MHTRTKNCTKITTYRSILFLRGCCLQQIVGDTGVRFFVFLSFGPDAMLGRRAAAMLAYRPTGSAWQRPVLLNVLCFGLLLKLRSFLIVCQRGVGKWHNCSCSFIRFPQPLEVSSIFPFHTYIPISYTYCLHKSLPYVLSSNRKNEGHS